MVQIGVLAVECFGIIYHRIVALVMNEDHFDSAATVGPPLCVVHDRDNRIGPREELVSGGNRLGSQVAMLLLPEFIIIQITPHEFLDVSAPRLNLDTVTPLKAQTFIDQI